MLKRKLITLGIAIGAFIAGSQFNLLINKIKTNQNYLPQAIIFIIGLIIAGISLYLSYQYKNK